MELNFITR